MADVTRDERYPASNASYALNVLVGAGLAAGAVDADDRRMRIITLTEAGRQLHAEIRRVSPGDDRAVAQAMKAAGLLAAAASRPLADIRGPAARGVAIPLLMALDADLVYGPDASRRMTPPAAGMQPAAPAE